MIERKALSPVISTVILSAVVLAIGGSIWSYSAGAATVIADGYVNDTLDLVNEVTERFMIEHVSYDSTPNDLTVWVYNYGDQVITIDLYATVNSVASGEFEDSTQKVIGKGLTEEIVIELSLSVDTDDEVSLKAHSRRQNNAYETYYIP